MNKIFLVNVFHRPAISDILVNEPNLGMANRGLSLQLWYQSLGLRSMRNPVCYVPRVVLEGLWSLSF